MLCLDKILSKYLSTQLNLFLDQLLCYSEQTFCYMVSPPPPPLSLCHSQEEDEFRDKLTPISLALNYSLAPPSNLDLPPVLNRYSSTFLQEQVCVCGGSSHPIKTTYSI